MTVSIYPRKLLFFTFVILAIFGIGRLVTNSGQSSASVSASSADIANQSATGNSYYLEMNATKDSSVYAAGKKIPNAIQARSDIDELRLLVLNQPNQSYQDVKIVLNLPQKINKLVKDPQIIAVHGATPVSAELVGGNRIVFDATNVTQAATVTVVAQFPKGYFTLPASAEISRSLNSIPGYIWVLGGAILPPIALFVILFMFFGSKFQLKKRQTKGLIESPPQKISPALASVIINGHATPETLMAALIDLSQRGFIEIYNRGGDFTIYKKDALQSRRNELKNWEKILLEKIFLPKQKAVDALDLEERMSRHLFSRKVALVYLGIYDELESMGYFSELPAKLHLKYRMVGILTFFVGLIGYIAFAFSIPDPKFMLIFWLSLIGMGVLIINLAPSLTGFSAKGEAERMKWLEFKNYLSFPDLIRGKDEIFEQYIGYAVGMKVEIDWAARFSDATFRAPDWYGYVMPIEGVEGFAKTFLPIVNFLGTSINASNEPLVK